MGQQTGNEHIYDVSELNEIHDQASPFNRYIGFTGGLNAGVYLTSDLDHPPRVVELDLRDDPEDTIITLNLQDKTRCSLGRQNTSLFNHLNNLGEATMIVRCKNRTPEKYFVPIASAKA